MPTSIATDHAAITSDNRMLSRVVGRTSAMAFPAGASAGRRAAIDPGHGGSSPARLCAGRRARAVSG
jgi:N-acetylmuramoyl-L-alanine amidase